MLTWQYHDLAVYFHGISLGFILDTRTDSQAHWTFTDQFLQNSEKCRHSSACTCRTQSRDSRLVTLIKYGGVLTVPSQQRLDLSSARIVHLLRGWSSQGREGWMKYSTSRLQRPSKIIKWWHGVQALRTKASAHVLVICPDIVYESGFHFVLLLNWANLLLLQFSQWIFCFVLWQSVGLALGIKALSIISKAVQTDNFVLLFCQSSFNHVNHHFTIAHWIDTFSKVAV